MKRLSQVLATLMALCALTQVTVPAEWSALTEAFTVTPVLAQEPVCEWCVEAPTGMVCQEEEPAPWEQAAGPFDWCTTVGGQGCGPDCTGCDHGWLCDPHLASVPGLAPSGVALYAQLPGVQVQDGIARTRCGSWVVAVLSTGPISPDGERRTFPSDLVLRL